MLKIKIKYEYCGVPVEIEANLHDLDQLDPILEAFNQAVKLVEKIKERTE